MIAFGIGGIEVPWGANFDNMVGIVIIGFGYSSQGCAEGCCLFGFTTQGVIFEAGFGTTCVDDLGEVPAIVSNGIVDDVRCIGGRAAGEAPDSGEVG